MPRLPIFAALAEEQNLLDVVLDHTVWLIRFAVVATAVSNCFHGAVRNFVPYNRGEIIETEVARSHLDVRVERRNPMAAFVLSSWYADVADHAANTPARHKHPRAFPPDIV